MLGHDQRLGVACALVALACSVPAPTYAQSAQVPPADQGPVAAEPDRAQPAGPTELTHIAPTRSLPVKSRPLDVPVPRTGAGQRLKWDPAWRRFDNWDWALTLAAGATAATMAIAKPVASGRKGGILFDEDVRNAVRFEGYDQRGTARDTSDVLLTLTTTYPFLVDALITAWWYRGSPDVAREMVLIDLETVAVTAAVQGVVNVALGRERPYGRTCGGETPEDSLDCQGFRRFRSSFSGHSSQTFASASVICTQHLNLHLFGNDTADAVTCASAYAAAASTALLRVVGDVHYATDVIAGAAAGTAIGLGLPYLLHYRRSASHAAANRDGVQLRLVPTMSGAAAVGTF